MAPRILEIGHLNFVKEAFPDETERIDTTFYVVSGAGLRLGVAAKVRAVAAQFVRLCRSSFRRRYEVVFCRCFGRFIYRPDFSLPVNALRLLMSWFIKLCVWWQVAHGARLAVVDQLDEMTIDVRDMFLLRRCAWYFKRELPQNTWNIFLRVQPRHGEWYFLTQNPGYLPYLHRFAPVSLGITGEKVRRIEEILLATPDAEKDLDVFFAGSVDQSTVRSSGLAPMEELRRRGYRVEVHLTPLSFDEFVRRMRRAWLVWSPEGQGWDCYRHYEACIAGSVPLINAPGIRRHAPMLPGVHFVQYAVEGNDLCLQAERALADRDALRRMSVAARELVVNFHTYAKLGEYMARHVQHAATPPMPSIPS